MRKNLFRRGTILAKSDDDTPLGKGVFKGTTRNWWFCVVCQTRTNDDPEKHQHANPEVVLL